MAAGAIAAIGADAILGMFKNEADRKHQNELIERQRLQAQKLFDYQQQGQYDLWQKTGPVGQVEQYKKAGLNPALMYGMSGGGGQTTGGSMPGAPSGNAPQIEIPQITGMAMQLQLLKAQKENIEADTKVKLGEAANKPIQGQNIQASTASLTQGVENQKAQQTLTQVQTRLAKIDEWIKGKSADDAAEIIAWQAQKAVEEVDALHMQNLVSNQVMDEKVSLVEQELIGKILENRLTSVASQKGLSDIQVNKAQINKIAIELQQKWKELDIKTFEAEMKANYPGLGQTAGNLLQQLYNEIDKLMGSKQSDRTPNKVKHQ